MNRITHFLWVLIVLIVPQQTFAAPILGSEPQSSAVGTPRAQKISDSSSSSINTLSTAPVRLTLQVGTAFDSNTLTGTGFTSALSLKKTAITWGGEVEYHLDSGDLMFFGRARSWSATYSAIPLVTPSLVDVKKQVYTLGAAFYPWDEKFAFTTGITMQTRDATQTVPNALVTSVKKYGVELGGLFETRFGEDWIFGSRGSVFFPVYYNEAFQNTGYYIYSMSIDSTVSIAYVISSIVSLGTRVWVRYDNANFRGTGLRGVTNGTDNGFSIGVPLELQISF